MIAPLVVRLGRLLLAAGCGAALCLVPGCAAASQHVPSPGRTVAGPVTGTPPLTGTPRSQHARGETAPVDVPAAIGGGPARLADELTSAETVLGEGDASPPMMTRQAMIVQLVCMRLASRPGWAGTVIDRVAPSQRAAAADDIAAAADLEALTPPAARLPRWRIVPAEKLAALRADYRAAQAATGVGWSYLAAINLVESDFGRIAGPSNAGAQGPMQFLPATWSIYGRGDVHRARDAIFAAARFLAGHGAPADIDSAVYSYNPSWRYADAIVRYAARLRADPDALSGYYYRAVTYRLTRGWVLLPSGYGSNPAVRPVPLRI